ncbi:MAG: TM2 domain-containing protein [Pseudomonadota bacterium]
MVMAADPDFAQEVVDELYRYRPRRLRTAKMLLVFTGLLGGHRFYLGKPLSGVLFFLTAGGVFVL